MATQAGTHSGPMQPAGPFITFQSPQGERYFEESSLSSAGNVLLRQEGKEGSKNELSQFIQLPKAPEYEAKFAWIEINQKENKITSKLNSSDFLRPPLPVKYNPVATWIAEDGKKQVVVEYELVHG